MPSIIIPTTDALDEPTILRALRKLIKWCTSNFQKIADNQDVIAIDTSLSASSTNPVQNQVITIALDELDNRKIDVSSYIRKIYIGVGVPSDNVGEVGDLWIVRP